MPTNRLSLQTLFHATTSSHYVQLTKQRVERVRKNHQQKCIVSQSIPLSEGGYPLTKPRLPYSPIHFLYPENLRRVEPMIFKFACFSQWQKCHWNREKRTKPKKLENISFSGIPQSDKRIFLSINLGPWKKISCSWNKNLSLEQQYFGQSLSLCSKTCLTGAFANACMDIKALPQRQYILS